jgi:PAS domain S-box-containing protein
MNDQPKSVDVPSEDLENIRTEMENCRKFWRDFSNADDRYLYIKDENLKYVFCNNALAKRFGKTPEEIKGLDDFDLTDRETAESRRLSDRAVIEQGSHMTYELSLSGFIYRVTKFPLKMRNGKTGVGGYIQNITDIRRHERRQEQIIHRHQILSDVLTRSFSGRQEHLDYVLNEAVAMTESEYGYIYFYNEDTRQFTINSWSKKVMDICRVSDPPTNYDLDDTGIWGEVVRQRKPIVVHDLQQPNPMKKGCPDGHVILHSFMTIPIMIDGKIVGVTGLANKKGDYDEEDISDVTMLMNGTWNAIERRMNQEKLVFERNKYLLTLFSIGDGVMVVDRDGRIEMLNHVASELTGWTLEEAAGRNYKEVFRLTHETKGTGFLDPIERVLMSDSIQEMEESMVLTSKNGTKYILEDSAAPIMDERDVTLGVVLVFRNITDKVDQRKRIEYLSYHDYLTGLYNRMFFEEEMRRVDTERNLPISVIMGDLNGLKLTNDFFGHSYGDMLLKRRQKSCAVSAARMTSSPAGAATNLSFFCPGRL